ncbi:MAG: pyrroline-5-carboxylate reductase [Lachnospiraceae bacterium]|nr:pyrroline-5-carboxylate reductase [Lachnospiraceae bacterium]
MKLGFIGCGNMATAIMGGIIKKGLVKKEDITGADTSAAARQKVSEAYGINTVEDNREVIKASDVVFFAVKPQFLHDMAQGIKDVVREDQVIISIAAGRSLKLLQEEFPGKNLKIVRLMPNTPALVGESMTAMCANNNVTDEEKQKAMELISSFGRAVELPERLFDTVTAVSGSSPAYVFMFIEAMADAAVLGGMPRNMAYEFAAQSVLGSAKMVLDTGKHPGELKDMVTSPAGTTIEAVRVLEEGAFRSTVIEAVEACREKSEEMGKK